MMGVDMNSETQYEQNGTGTGISSETLASAKKSTNNHSLVSDELEASLEESKSNNVDCHNGKIERVDFENGDGNVGNETNGDLRIKSETQDKDSDIVDCFKEQENEGLTYQPTELNFDSPLMVLDFKNEFNAIENNYTRGCKWSPDGLCLLTASNDNKLRIFNLPSPVLQRNFPNEAWFTESDLYEKAAVTVQERELVYDYTWYPAMRSDNPHSCCFAVTSRDQPVHLWDAWYGKLVCSYSSYDHLDQMVAANSTAFNLDGTLLVCGFNKCLRIFHTRRPGRICQTIHTTKKGEVGQPGIISCMAFHPQLTSVLAAGSYLGTIGLYHTVYNKPVCIIEGMEGVTHLKFSADGTKLFSGMRKGDEILCHDMRNPHKLYGRYRREVATHQRIYFDMDPVNKYLVSGNTNGQVSIWNLMDYNGDLIEGPTPTQDPSSTFLAHKDCTNGVSVNPYFPIMATSSGQRHFPEVVSDSESDREDSQCFFKPCKSSQENTVKLWWLG